MEIGHKNAKGASLAFLTTLLCVFLFSGSQAYAAGSATLTFSDDAITETVGGSGYSISEDAATSAPVLTITSAGTYTITGSCSNGSIVVAKGLSDVTLILDDLTLASSDTAPLVVKKNAVVSIHLEGTSTLTDNEDPDDETSSDTTVAEAFEGACIKVKSGSAVTFCGDGDLACVANAKNAIKGGATASLVFNQSGSITVSGNGTYSGGTASGAAANNGIACDGSLTFNQGTYVIKATGDGIKSAPDATDESEGTTVDSDSAGSITINGGTFDIDVDGDGIQADTALTINGGDIDIRTWKGYGTWNSTLAEANSCKGLKASGDRATELGLEPVLAITGGTFTLDTGDDAVHSDAYATVTGGTFAISTGDDGMHADTSLILGSEDGLARDPDVTISASYEGLEGGTVYLYSGRYQVLASDDGVNAAGGSSSGSDPWPGGGGDPFNPGGGGPGGPGGPNGLSGSDDYNIFIYGGDLYVCCSGDGLDSNGGLYLYGGTQVICSQGSTEGNDNSALDADGTVLIQGATVFTAGNSGMDGSAQASWFGTGQKYKVLNSSLSAGKILNATVSGTTVFSFKLPKSARYFMYSAPATATPSLATASSLVACKAGSQSHSWGAGTVTTEATTGSTGLTTYTCSACGTTETQTIPALVSVAACDHSADTSGDDEEDQGYTVSFPATEGVESIYVYYTQDYASPDQTIAGSSGGTAVSRSSDTGEPDSTGSGQVNFAIVLADGYSLDSTSPVSISGTYKNLKDISSDAGVDNAFRITKIGSELTVTITTECTGGGTTKTGSIEVSGSDRYATAAAIATTAYTSASGVIVATGENFPDALGASGLAGMLGYPIVLTSSRTLSSDAVEAISALGATDIIIVGGTGAVSSTVEDQLASYGNVTRISGSDRYATAEAIYSYGLQAGTWGDTAIIATGTNYPDALSISGYAFAGTAPIFLCGSGGLTDQTKSYLQSAGFAQVIIVGGTGVVSEEVEDWVASHAADNVIRLGGANRYATSSLIAGFVLDAGGTANGACIATGQNFPDALAGCSLAGVGKSILLLADSADISALDVLAAHASDIDVIYFLGGTGAVTSDVRAAAEEAAGMN